MAFKDMLKSFVGKVSQGPLKREPSDADKVSSLTNGGFTGYHPKADAESVKRGRKRGNAPEATAQQVVYNEPLMQTGYQNPQGGFAFQQNGYQQPVQQQPFGGYQAQGYQPQQAEFQAQGYHSQKPDTQAAQPAGQGGNISYIYSSYAGENGEGYRHIERLAQITSTASCYRVIEFMRNGESTIVNVDELPDDRERQRCLDLLYGAAFTMQCTFIRISRKSVYLIAPKGVCVMPYESMRQMANEDLQNNWPGSGNGNEPMQSRPAPGRERAHGNYTPYVSGDRYTR